MQLSYYRWRSSHHATSGGVGHLTVSLVTLAWLKYKLGSLQILIVIQIPFLFPFCLSMGLLALSVKLHWASNFRDSSVPHWASYFRGSSVPPSSTHIASPFGPPKWSGLSLCTILFFFLSVDWCVWSRFLHHGSVYNFPSYGPRQGWRLSCDRWWHPRTPQSSVHRLTLTFHPS